jgi:hypothetical protein
MPSIVVKISDLKKTRLDDPMLSFLGGTKKKEHLNLRALTFKTFKSDVFVNLETLQKWYFVNKIVRTYCEKKCSSDRDKLCRLRICKIFGITRTIYSNSERSEHFW